MARRTLDHKKLRVQAEHAEKKAAADPAVKKASKKKADKTDATGAVKVKKPRAKKVKIPPRMRVRWCIYDGSMKAVAVFDYQQKSDAQARLAQCLEKKPGYFMQLVKEAMPLPEPEDEPAA